MIEGIEEFSFRQFVKEFKMNFFGKVKSMQTFTISLYFLSLSIQAIMLFMDKSESVFVSIGGLVIIKGL